VLEDSSDNNKHRSKRTGDVRDRERGITGFVTADAETLLVRMNAENRDQGKNNERLCYVGWWLPPLVGA